MIFRYLLRRRIQSIDRKVMLAVDYQKQVESGAYDRFSRMSEWRAFQHFFFPMSIIREAEPQVLSELQRHIKRVLADAKEKEKHDNNTPV